MVLRLVNAFANPMKWDTDSTLIENGFEADKNGGHFTDDLPFSNALS